MTKEEFQNLAKNEIEEAEKEVAQVVDESSLNAFKGKYLGKKSHLTSYYSLMKEVAPAEKKDFGMELNNLRSALSGLLSAKQKELSDKALAEKLEKEKVDITRPGYHASLGSKHPFYAVIDDVTDFFLGLGYTVADGPEVETDENNFELMNIPKDHPARDMQDSFSLGDNLVLRSHTSAVQARVMKAANGVGPIKVICPGKVYRRDNDATHSPEFGQIEGLVISEDATFSNLLETLTLLLRHLFGEKREVRFRPSFFPFTEPSVEADISCFECNGKGCALCKHTGWIEILGSGMVHPNVLRLNGFDDKKYRGYAFGIGIDRVAMLKYGIDDIKRLYTDDVAFVEQFRKE